MTFTELIFGLMPGLLDQLPRINRNRFVNDQLHYLRELFRDSTTSSLADTKNCHRRVLEALEKGEVSPHRWTEWNNRRREALDRIHRTSGNPAKNTNKKPGTAATTPTSKSSKRERPCSHWNQNKCNKCSQDHDTPSITWLHVCSYCFTFDDRQRHRETACYRKEKDQSKNAKGPSRGAN